MKRLIIGFGHKRRMGKDLCGHLLARHLIVKSVSRHHVLPLIETDCFARSLKAACRAAFGFSTDQVWGDKKLVVDSYWGFTPAWALQKMGTEAMRHAFGDDFWVKTLGRRINAAPDATFIITDVRFPNEAAAIKSWGGYVVDVIRHNEVVVDGRDSEHPSETALDDYTGWDGIIINDGTIEELRDKVVTLVDSFIQRQEKL